MSDERGKDARCGVSRSFDDRDTHDSWDGLEKGERIALSEARTDMTNGYTTMLTEIVRRLWALLIVMAVWSTDGHCTAIRLANVSLGARDAGTGNAPVSFDIAWDRSWRSTGAGAPAPNNWDAAWVFVKYRKNGGVWAHASLNNTGHTVPSGASLDVGVIDTSSAFNIATNPGVGVFIYRSVDGTGTFSKTGFSLIWKFAQDGVATGDTVDIRVYAIEMVYVPTGPFYAGDNATSTSSFKQGSADDDPWYIGSEDAITVGDQAGSGTGVGDTNSEYYYVSAWFDSDDITGASFTIPATFPKGYEKFYMMKGEVSQGQWINFFNTLTDTQKIARDITSTVDGKQTDTLTGRNNVRWTSGDATLPDQGGGATYDTVAMGYTNWGDYLAFLDWTGLRPMTELEFEKAARGPYPAVSGEYTWGTTSVTAATSISNAGKSNEVPQIEANCVVGGSSGLGGPMRVGSTAAGKSTRVASGAGYYGAMDLSGNLLERTVTVGNSAGRSFQRRYHGNGTLTTAGGANVTSWPSHSGGGQRGSAYYDAAAYGRTSDRRFAGYSDEFRSVFSGIRGVRSAP